MGGQNPNAGVAGASNDATNASLQMYLQQIGQNPMLKSQPLQFNNNATPTNIKATGEWADANAHPEIVGQAWGNAMQNVLSSAGQAYAAKVAGDQQAMQDNKAMLQNASNQTEAQVALNGPQPLGNLSDRPVAMDTTDPKYLEFLNQLRYNR